MRTLHFDAFSGVSGDMTVAALIDLGASFESVREQLARLPLGGYQLRLEEREVNGIRARKFDVALAGAAAPPSPAPGRGAHAHAGAPASHAHRTFASIKGLLAGGDLKPGVRERALAVFATLAAAEGEVHGVAADDVTFHEVGAVDSIVDIVATAIALEELQVEHVSVSSLPLGSGTVRSQHGVLPVPAPATVLMLRGFDVRLGDGEGELVTPTGAAIVATLAKSSGPILPMCIERVGYGAGTRVLADRPNVLRLLLGERSGADLEELVLLETNIDDSNPEIYEFVLERLFAAGARDAWLTPVQMKKGRPGTVLAALGDVATRDALATVILRETSALGLRFQRLQRLALAREQIEVDTEYGAIAVKIGRAPDGTANVAPEYASCRERARALGVPLKVVYRAAVSAAHLRLRS